MNTNQILAKNTWKIMTQDAQMAYPWLSICNCGLHFCPEKAPVLEMVAPSKRRAGAYQKKGKMRWLAAISRCIFGISIFYYIVYSKHMIKCM